MSPVAEPAFFRVGLLTVLDELRLLSYIVSARGRLALDSTNSNSPSPEPQLKQILSSEKVRHVMRREPFTVSLHSPVGEAVEGIKARPTNYALVVDGESLAGIFTERDYLDKIVGNGISLERPVDEFMTKEPRCIGPDDSILHALDLIVEGGYRHIPVVENDKLVGVLTALSIVRYIAELFPTEVYNLPPRPDQVMSQAEGG